MIQDVSSGHSNLVNNSCLSLGRPLPEEMVKYAREDTHYLLYIYDHLRNELIKNGNAQKNLLKTVYNRSRDVCLKVG